MDYVCRTSSLFGESLHKQQRGDSLRRPASLILVSKMIDDCVEGEPRKVHIRAAASN